MCERDVGPLPLALAWTESWTHNPDLGPDQEIEPFALQDDAPPAEPHQSGLNDFFYLPSELSCDS